MAFIMILTRCLVATLADFMLCGIHALVNGNLVASKILFGSEARIATFDIAKAGFMDPCVAPIL